MSEVGGRRIRFIDGPNQGQIMMIPISMSCVRTWIAPKLNWSDVKSARVEVKGVKTTRFPTWWERFWHGAPSVELVPIFKDREIEFVEPVEVTYKIHRLSNGEFIASIWSDLEWANSY